MSFEDKKGIVVASGFKLQAETLLDARQQVDTLEDLNELVTLHAAVEGLRVYVKANKTNYVYNGTSWDKLTIGTGYTHPTGDGYHHVPATGTTNNGKFLKAGATAESESWEKIKVEDIEDFPESSPTAENLVIKLNGGTEEGTNQFTFNGSAEKSVNITPDNIGAAASDHDHTHDDITDFDNAVTALIPSIPTSLPNPHAITFTGAVEETYDGSAAKTVNIPTSGATDSDLIIQLNGGSQEDTNKFTFDGSQDKTVNITPNNIGAAASDHDHTHDDISDFNDAVARLIPAIPTKLPNPHAITFTGAVEETYDGSAAKTVNIPTSGATDSDLIIQLNGGSQEDTNKFTFDGSQDKTVNITPSSIGAATEEHTHTHDDISDFDNAVTELIPAIPTKLPNPYAITFTGAVEETYDGSAAKSINIPETSPTNEDLIIKLNNGAVEGTSQFTFDGSAAKTVNITPTAIGAAASDHDHTHDDITDFDNAVSALIPSIPTSLPNPYAITFTGATEDTYDGSSAKTVNIPETSPTDENLIIKFNGGNTEGSSKFTFDGSAAKTVNITPSAIGAAASSHTHNYAGSSSAGGAATSALKVNVPVGTILFSTSTSTTFFRNCFGGTWTIVGNMDAVVSASNVVKIYMFRKTAS